MRSLLLFVALSMIAGCMSPRHAALPATSRATLPPSEIDVARYAEQVLAENYKTDGPGAAVIIARGDRVLFRGARGMADVEHAVPLAADATFKIGSITKQFAAAGLLKLVEAGKVSLDDPLSKYVKDYPDGDKITVLELLNHTSGVKSYTDIRAADDVVPQGTTTTQLIDSFKNAKPEFAPGDSWAYDNSGYVLVGAVIEAASGLAWHVYLQQALFQPLGLSHTGYDEDFAIAAKQVHGYTLSDGKPVPARGVSAVHADGALVSNVDDLLKWNGALHEGRVLERDTYRRMITPVGKAAPERYGFALWHTALRDHEMVSHSGHISGFSAFLLYLPHDRISVAILQNMDRASGVLDPTVGARKLAAFAIGDPYTTPEPATVDASTLQHAQGVFGVDPPGPQEFSVGGARVLQLIDGRLTVAHTGGERSELIPVGADTFQFRDGFDRLQLVRNSDGDTTALRSFAWGEGEGLLLARTQAQPTVGPRPVALSHAALSRVVGSYPGDSTTLRIFLDGEQLKADLGQPPSVTLLAESPGRFVVAEVDATLEFAPAEGAPQRATLRQGNERVEFKRKPRRPRRGNFGR